MGKAAKAVEVAEVRAYLERRGGRPVTLVAMTPLGASTQLGLKTYGYGKPLRVRWEDAGGSHDAVLRTMAPDPYGHDRRSDRVAALFGAYDDFAAQPSSSPIRDPTRMDPTTPTASSSSIAMSPRGS